MERDSSKEQEQLQLSSQLAAEQRKKEEEDKRVQEEKLKRLKQPAGARGGLFGDGETLG